MDSAPAAPDSNLPSRARTGIVLIVLAVGIAALALVADAIVLSLASAATVAGAVERHALSGSRVRIYNLVGTLQVVRGSGRDVEVEIRTGGPDAERLRIEKGPIGDAQTLRIVYPDRRILYRHGNSQTTMQVRDDGRFGDTHLREFLGGSAHRVTISDRGSGLEAHADLVVRIPAGRNVGLFLGVGDVKASGVEGDLRIDVAAASVEARGLRGRILVDTGSGDVVVDDVNGELSVDTGSGGVHVSQVRGDTVHLDTGSGGVRVSDVQTGVVYVDTGSGDVELSDIRSGDVHVDTGSGSVELGLMSDVERLSIDTGSGGVVVTAPPTLGAMVRIETGSGSVDTDFPLTRLRRNEDSVEGQIGDGRGRILIETGSGSIRLRNTGRR